MQNELLDGFFLNGVRIEPLTGSVFATAGVRHLPSKSMEVLLCLAKNPRHLVSREEILAHVWGSEDASQVSLNHAISDIRHALGDQATKPVFIQTVPKRGFRLLVEPGLEKSELPGATTTVPVLPAEGAPFLKELMNRGVVQAGLAYLVIGWALIQVSDVTFENLGLPDWSVPFVTFVVVGGFPIALILAWFLETVEGRLVLDTGKRSTKLLSGLGRNYASILGAYAIAFIGAGIYQVAIGFTPPTRLVEVTTTEIEDVIPIEPNSIAVLRFLNIDGSERSQIFSNGFAEDVLDRLARIPGLLVSSRGDAWSLPDSASSEQVRRRLRVAYFLEGSVRLNGDNLRVVVQLIDSETGFHIISRSFDKNITEFIDVEREITDLTIANLRVALPEETQLALDNSFIVTDVDAYVLYRRGKEIFLRPQTEESLNEAIELYKQALSIDPEYAAANAGLCASYVAMYEVTNHITNVTLAEAQCSAALQTNPNLHMVYTALGDLNLLTGEYRNAEAAFQRALNINARDVEAMRGLAEAYERQQKMEEAEALLRTAAQLQPGNWRSMDAVGSFLFSNGRSLEAADFFRKVIALDPGNFQGHGNLGSALLMAGEFAPAATALGRALEFEYDAAYASNLGIINYYLGNYDDAVAMQRTVVDAFPESGVDWLTLGDALTFSSEQSEAGAAYRKSIQLFEKQLTVNPGDPRTLYRVAWAYAMLGEIEKAQELIAQSKEIAPQLPYVHYYSALLNVKNNKDEAAMDDLAEAVDKGYSTQMLALEPFLADISKRADFAELVKVD